MQLTSFCANIAAYRAALMVKENNTRISFKERYPGIIVELKRVSCSQDCIPIY